MSLLCYVRDCRNTAQQKLPWWLVSVRLCTRCDQDLRFGNAVERREGMSWIGWCSTCGKDWQVMEPHTHTHPPTHPPTHACTPGHTHARTHTPTHSPSLSHTQTSTLIYTHTHTSTSTCTCTYAYTYRLTLTLTLRRWLHGSCLGGLLGLPAPGEALPCQG